jgi:quercetin dioxygenase-like cupin family protein
MKKSNISGTGDKRNVNPDWFFEKGSRTKLHQHNGNQVLIGVKGKGSLEIFRKYGTSKNNFKIKKIEKISLNEGDIVHIPAKTLHTHGSIDKKKEFSHIAINILPRKNATYKTEWYESDFKTKVSKII